MQLRGELLNFLSDGEFHSGAVLGDALGVSRMAVCKHLKALRSLGVECESVRGKGYRLSTACELLNQAVILEQLGPTGRTQLAGLQIRLETGSTNTDLRELALQGAPTGTVCMAEMQSAGRGRRGRTWVSPFAGNLYLSMLWRSALGVAALGGLSLAVGIAVLRTLQAAGVDGVGLKWPNDLLVGGAKLAGVLIDVSGEAAGPCVVIIGVGINVRMPALPAAGIDQPWTDIASLLPGKVPSRNRLAASLIGHLFDVLAVFERQGLRPLLDEWGRHDVLAGQPVRLSLSHGHQTGIARGVDESGALLLESERGGVQRFTSGEVSVRIRV